MAGNDALRLSSLLAARLCHELIAPVSAICNGAELLGDDDADFMREAAGLVAQSAQRAACRLRFYRFAYGFDGGETALGTDPRDLVAGFFEASGIEAPYPAPIVQLPLVWQKLACNLLLLGCEGLPRGGRLALELDTARPTLCATGDGAHLSAERRAAIAFEMPAAALGPRTIQAYFTALLARDLGCRLEAATAWAGGFRLALAGSEARADRS